MNIALEDANTNPLLLNLLHASKAAERLISALFEVGAVDGEPFLSIWTHLAKAIDQAQRAVGSHEEAGKRVNNLLNSA